MPGEGWYCKPINIKYANIIYNCFFNKRRNLMNSTTKRVSLWILALVMALSVFVFTACQQTTEPVFVLNDDGTGYWLKKSGSFVAEQLTIPATYQGLPVLGVKDSAFKNCKNLKEIIITTNGGAQPFTIGLSSFKGCKSLQKVQIDGSGVVVIGNSAFSTCKNLQNVDITGASQVQIELYAFEYIDDITLSITGAQVDIESSVFVRKDDQLVTLNLTNCTGATQSGADNVNLVNCVLDQFDGTATNLLLDNTKLLDDEMFLYLQNATFRGTVVFHNNYKSGLFGKGKMLTNLTIESTTDDCSYSQVCKDAYYPLAQNITIGSNVHFIPEGLFGDASLAQLLKDDSIQLNITYQGAQSYFNGMRCHNVHNDNFINKNYNLTSADGQPCTITFIDDNGQVVATKQGEIGGNLYNQGLSLPNSTLVPGRLIDGYYKDAERTIAWNDFGNLLGDAVAYLSFVDGSLLSQAQLKLKQGSSINFDNNVYSVTTNVNSPIWLVTLQNELIASSYATVEYFADQQCTTPALTEFTQAGEHNVYIKVTSWDKSQTNVYLLKVIVKDIYTVTFQVEGSTFDTQSCVEGDMLAKFPTNPYKKGHTFVGWSTDGTESGIVSAQNYTPTSHQTLTAVFAKDVYTLTVKDTDLSYQVSYGDSIVLPYPQQKQYYTINGYKYNGNVLSTTEHEDGYAFVYNYEQSIQVEPNYVAKKYTITLDSDEHNDKYINYTVESNDFYLPNASRDWYAFVAWYTQENGQGEQVSLIDTSTPKDIKLYAYFTLANYTVSFKDGPNVVYSQKFNYENQTINIPEVPKKAGYNTSWQQFTISARSFEVQLVCNPIVYNITYNETFGLPNGNPDVYTVEDTLQLVTLQRTHYDFLGWQDEQGNLLSQIKAGTMGDLTLTAQWAITKYALNFYTDENTYTTERIQYGSTFNIDTLPTPTAKDKLFVGWYDSAQYTNAISGNVTVMGNTNLYAKWMDSTTIASAEDFEKIRENPSGTFHLTNDVDMTGNLVSPIAEFSGTLDGLGYKLFNFTLKINAQLNNFGLFATNSGTIRNLNVEQVICSVTTNPANSGEEDNIGVLVGVNKGFVIKCNVSSPSFTVTTNFGRSHFEYKINIGGLAGKNQGSLTNCQANITFTALLYPYNSEGYHHHYSVNLYTHIGGLVGVNSGSVVCGSSISSFTVTGNAHGATNNTANNYVYLGGLVGISDNGKSIEKSFATATVNSTIKYDGNLASGRSYTGGFIGINNGIIKESYATGNISTQATTINDIGGFAGQVGATGDISNCYTSASVTGNGASSVGGFVGYLAGSVQNCYAGGDVLVSNSSSNVGGFVGLIGSGGVANKCFTTSNVTASASKAGFFCANDTDGTGIVVNSYYSASACVSNNGSQLDRADENGAKRDYLSNITNQQFLQSKMYFYEDQWIFTTGVPVLRWEVQTDGSTLTNGSYYLCASCGEQFVNDNSVSATIYNDTAETCVTDGIRYFGCSNCNKHFAVITQPATGHSFTDDSAGKDFCNDNVLVTYTCKNSGCGYTYQQQFLATEHQHNHTDSCVDCGYVLVPSTCTTAGSLTFVCDDCGQSVTKVIPAEHNWQFISWSAQPTCTDNGWGNFCCSVCDPTNTTPIRMEVANSKLGHLDTSGDGLCDRDNCDALIYDATNAVQIATVSDLIAINLDISSGSMEKTYILTADIDLKDVAWNPIGTKSNPFTGVLLGNGHKISNVPLLCSDETIYYGGLFGYNQGIITELTVHFSHVDSFYEVCQNRDIVYGGICAYNNGTINQCTISGTASMHFLTYALNNTKGGSANASQNVTFGLVVGENNGFIVGTTVSANYSFVYENYAYLGQDINHTEVGLWTSGDYQRMYVTTTQTVTAGVICGKNSMNITNCSITGAGNVYNYLAMSQFMKGKYGTLTATSSQALGAFAGNQNLDGKQGNTLTGALNYLNQVGTHTPANGNDPGNSFYSMSSSTTIAIYQ